MKQLVFVGFALIVIIISVSYLVMKSKCGDQSQLGKIMTQDEIEEEENRKRAEELANQYIIMRKSIEEALGTVGEETNLFPNHHDGIYWSDRSLFTMKYNIAIQYCKLLGGKLPTISQLRTLVKNCPASEPGGDCKVTDDCTNWKDCRDAKCGGCLDTSEREFSVFGDKGWFWSSSLTTDFDNLGWLVNFDDGYIYNLKLFYHRHVRCVNQEK